MQAIVNNVPAVVVYATPGEECGQYEYTAYPVAAWAHDGMALLVVPGHARLVPANDPGRLQLKGECLGVQLVPSWTTDVDDTELPEPTGNGPFH